MQYTSTHYKVDTKHPMDNQDNAINAADYVFSFTDGGYLLFFAEKNDILAELWGSSTKHPDAKIRFSLWIRDYWDTCFGIYNVARWVIADGATLVGTRELLELCDFVKKVYENKKADTTGFIKNVIKKAKNME